MNFEPPQKPPAFDLTGREMGDYQFLRRLGRGGMADVYLAKQITLERKVALKVLKPELARDASYVKRFRQEAQAAARLRQATLSKSMKSANSKTTTTSLRSTFRVVT